MNRATLERPANLHEFRREPYPADLLPRGGSGLALFSSGFWGWNDAIHLADAAMTVACVDVDETRLLEMALLYPDTWTFHGSDVWEFAREHEGERFDVVTVDPWVPMMPEVLDDLALWCELAGRLVTVGCLLADPLPHIPNGWRTSLFPRNDRVGWLVLQQ